jgi:A/G-specific adenine glycosylase
MLQQTRVAAAVPYYERFLARFPGIRELASAPEQDLLAEWAGLGYYNRARNMQRAAQAMNGTFPKTWDEIRKLPGIGDYTAAAVGSIAFGLPHAAVDGNVLRVVARVTNDAGDIGSGKVRKRMSAVAGTLLDRHQPGPFNEAMMELGATVCLPGQPQCLLCPVSGLCEGRKAGRQTELPVKLRKAGKVRIDRTVFVIWHENSLLLWQRPTDAAKLAGFWELPEPEHLAEPVEGILAGRFRHSITNHEYNFTVLLWKEYGVFPRCKNVVKAAWIACNRLENMALSTTARKAISLARKSHEPGRV